MLVAAAGSAASDPRPGDDHQRRAAGAQAEALRDAGLHRLTVSLDTLRPDRFRQLTRFDELDRVLDGIATAAPLFPGLKIDTVVIRGVNDDEMVDLMEFGRRLRRRGPVHRVHGRRRRDALVDAARRVACARSSTRLRAHYGAVDAVVEESSAPADRYRLPDGTTFGIISSTTEPFCDELRSQPPDRRRTVVSLPLRRATAPTCAARCAPAPARGIWLQLIRADVGSPAAIAAPRSASPRAIALPSSRWIALERDPHLEMHTRGG